MMFVNIAMVILDITIIIITGVMMREFPLEESICVYVCVCISEAGCEQRLARYLCDDITQILWWFGLNHEAG